MVMFASTNVLTAGPEPPGPAPTLAVAGFVSRVTVRPPIVNVTDALPVTLPADGLVNVTWHLPAVVPVVAHVLLLMLNAAPFELTSVTVGFVPLGTFTNPFPLPPSCLPVTVNVSFAPTSFGAPGAMPML